MKKTFNKFTDTLHNYFTVFLPKQRSGSMRTILSAQQIWTMLLTYICETTGKKVETLTFDDFNRTAVLGFLDTAEQERVWLPQTRNHRLSGIRSFFRYVVGMNPTLAYYLEDLKQIPSKKTKNTSFILEYMSQKAVTAILCQPDTTKRMGVRDTFFLSLMYDTAARDDEMLSMSFQDIDPEGKKVLLLGKGNKPRMASIDDNTVAQFYRYAKLYHPESERTQPLFYTVRNGIKRRMSDDNVARFLSKYSKEAQVHCNEIPDKVYPHLLRKSRAFHMYQGGAPLEVVALILGHEDPMTTRVYARADLEMKRKILEQVKERGRDSERPEVEPVAIWLSNDEMIRKLCGMN